MEQTYPRFTPDMKKTHKILIPNMAPVQFRILAASMENHGYQVELLGNCGERVAELGLKYVHNDTCYPALLVIGQFLDALDSGKYDLDHTALIITQTGGGCRASNYIFLLRKALEKAGYGNIPVLSLNFSGLEKDSSMPMDLKFMRQALAAIYYGDLLMTLRAQTQPYELEAGAAERLQNKWLDILCDEVRHDKGYSGREMKAVMPKIAAEFAAIPVRRVPKVKVGVVGEIYVKYSPLGNNELEKFLASQDCEVNLPGLMGFVQYPPTTWRRPCGSTVALWWRKPLRRRHWPSSRAWRRSSSRPSRTRATTPPCPSANSSSCRNRAIPSAWAARWARDGC